MRRRFAALHPLLISAYPILYLYGLNAGKVPFSEVIFPLAIAWIIVSIVWFAAGRLFRDMKFGALLASGCVGLFFLTLPAFRILTSSGLPRTAAASVLAAAVVLGTAVAVYKRRQLVWLSTFLDVTATVAILALLATTLPKTFRSRDHMAGAPPVTFDVQPDAPRPDIYYIVLDGYGRSDVLSELYQFDNSTFTKKLEALGFYVAHQSTANYNQTLFSLASALNFSYLDDLAARVGTASDERAFVRDLIFDNQVVARLKELGYRFVTFSTGFWGTDRMGSVDVRLSGGSGLSEFQNVLLLNSPIPAISASLPVGSLRNFQFDAHRSTIRYVFEELPRLPDSPDPRFVFAHIVSPHPPFVFGAEGEPVNPASGFTFDDGDLTPARRPPYIQGYAGQARFIIAQVTDMVAGILARDPGAVIIVQGDHGPRGHLVWHDHTRTDMRETLAILNAYHVPPGLKSQLYSHISPVNTFRLVFNHFFGSELTLLPDEAYFSSWSAPYRFRKVTQQVNAGPQPVASSEQ